MAVEVERLVTILEARISGYERELRKSVQVANRSASQVEGRFGTMNRRMTLSMGTAVRSLSRGLGALGISLGAVGFAIATKRAIDFADGIAKTADRIGLGVEAFQELSFAADEAGVSQDVFTQSMSALIRRQGEAISGNKTFLEGFTRLGITLEELRSLSPEDLLGRVADGVNDLGSQAAKIAALDRVMSETGRRMVNFTDLGSEGLAKIREEARRMGIVLDESMIREAEKANDALGRMERIVNTNLNRGLLALVPTIISLGQAFAEAAPHIANWINSLIPNDLAPIEELEKRAQELRDELLSREIEGAPWWMPGGAFAAGLENIRGQIVDVEGRLKILRSLRDAAGDGAGGDGGAGDAAAKAAEAITDLREALQFELDQLSRTEVGQRLYAEAKKAGVEVNKEFVASIQPLLIAIEAEATAAEQAAEREKAAAKEREETLERGAAIFEATRTPQEQYAAKLEELNELLRQGAIDQDTYNRAVKQAGEDLKKASEETDLLKRGQEDLGNTVKDVGDEALRGNLQTWEDWANFALRQIGRVLDGWIELLQKQAETGQGGGGDILSLISQGIGSIGGFFGGGAGAPPGSGPSGVGVASGSLLPPRAGGGPVRAGTMYRVNELGTESFVPNVNGYVLDAQKTMAARGGGGSQVLNYQEGPITINGTNLSPAQLKQAMREERRRNKMDVAEQARRGGRYSRAFA